MQLHSILLINDRERIYRSPVCFHDTWYFLPPSSCPPILLLSSRTDVFLVTMGNRLHCFRENRNGRLNRLADWRKCKHLNSFKLETCCLNPERALWCDRSNFRATRHELGSQLCRSLAVMTWQMTQYPGACSFPHLEEDNNTCPQKDTWQLAQCQACSNNVLNQLKTVTYL